MNKLFYTWRDFQKDVNLLVETCTRYSAIYGVPRGGIPLAVALSQRTGIPIIEDKEQVIHDNTVLVVDDIVDSGKTRNKFLKNNFIAIHGRCKWEDTLTINCLNYSDDWIVYPWEVDTENTGPTDSVTRLIEFIGEDPNREGIIDTPKRVIKSYEEIFKGYIQEPSQIFTTFDSEGYDSLVMLKNIEIYSMCEHHMLPFFGKAHIAYIPDGKIIGISKLARLAEIYSRRMQIQERIGEQITSDLMKYLKPKGAACIIEASHLCMRMRGVSKQNSTMMTSSLKGVFLENISARQELMELIKD